MAFSAPKTNFNHSSAPSDSSSAVPADVMIPRLMVICSVTALCALGLVMVFSAGSIESISQGEAATSYLVRQLLWIAIGVALCLGVVKFIDYHRWLGPLSGFFLAGCLVLLALTPIIGTEILGAKRWIFIGSFSLQPSEFAKIAFLLMMARCIVGYIEGRYTFRSALGQGLAFVLFPLMFLYGTQSDLGTTVICLVGILTLLWVGEIPVRYFVGIICCVVAFGLVAVFGTGYRTERLNFLDPFADQFGTGYQLVHSLYAFAQGGIFGKGLGNSAEKYLYLPEAETDFVFSILGEEMGLVGTLLVIGLFLVFLVGGLRIAQQAPDRFGQIICVAFTVILVFQAFLNMACVMGMFPTTGKTLPFMSYGGSSMLSSMIMVGIILSVSFGSDDSQVYRQRREDLRYITADKGGREGAASGSRSASGPRFASGLRADSGSRRRFDGPLRFETQPRSRSQLTLVPGSRSAHGLRLVPGPRSGSGLRCEASADSGSRSYRR